MRLLVAEDERDLNRLIRKTLEKEGYGVDACFDGEEVFDYLLCAEYDALVLDIMMPKMDGITVLKKLRREGNTLPVLLLTARDSIEDRVTGLDAGADDYLVKPFPVERALNTLRRIRERLLESAAAQAVNARPRPRQAPARLMLKSRDGLSFVDIEDILLVQREERQTVIYTVNDGRYVTSEGLSELEERLPANMFFRTHKSYIVNIDQIESITPYGRWTYIVRLCGTKRDALITHERFDELQKLFS